MVAPERQGKHLVFERLVHPMRHFLTGLSYLVEILSVSITEMLLLRDLHMDVARILHLVAQALERVIQARGAHRRWPHIHPTTFLSKVEGNAKYPDLHQGSARS